MPRPGGVDPVRDHFSTSAHLYARFRPRYPPELAAYLATLIPPGSLAWEAGCGSGQLSTVLLGSCARVVASDASAQQIAQAPSPGARLHYLVERAEASALAYGVARLCVSAQAAHWFDLDGYYSEVNRVGARGGVVAMITYGRVAGPPDLNPLIHHLYEVILAPHWPRERTHVEEGYQTLPFPFSEVPSPGFQLREEWTADAFLGYVSTWSAVNNLLRQGGEAAFAEFAAALHAEWRRADPIRALHWPVKMRLGVI